MKTVRRWRQYIGQRNQQGAGRNSCQKGACLNLLLIKELPGAAPPSAPMGGIEIAHVNTGGRRRS